MNFRVTTGEDRADVIAYLRQQSGKVKCAGRATPVARSSLHSQ